MSDQVHPEDLPKVLEKRALDAHAEAWLLENGSVIIVNSVGGIETIFTAERAYNLLNFLSRHGTTFLHILRPKTLTLHWKKSEGRLLGCLQQAAAFYQEREDEPGYSWHVLLKRSLSTLTEGIYTPQELLTAIAETPDTVHYGITTLFYDDTWQGQQYEGRLVFAALYLEQKPSDMPVALFYREEVKKPDD